MPIEARMISKDGALVPDSDDPEALLRDAKRYRRDLQRMLKRMRSGRTSADVRQAIIDAHEGLASKCEQRAEQIRLRRTT